MASAEVIKMPIPKAPIPNSGLEFVARLGLAFTVMAAGLIGMALGVVLVASVLSVLINSISIITK